MESVDSITVHNATFLPEYLLPQTRRLANDPDVFVRATYARALVRLADAAVRMLEISHASQPESRKDLPKLPDSDYDSMLAEIQNVIEEQATMLLVDSNSNVKRSMLASISDLCLFFGRQKSSDAVLSHIMTYLNDRDWQLRLAFFDGIVTVGAFIGIRAIHEYVLPLMLQALAGEFALHEEANHRFRGSSCRPSDRISVQSRFPGTFEANVSLGRLSPSSGLPVPPEYVDSPEHSRLHRGSRSQLAHVGCLVHFVPIFAVVPSVGHRNVGRGLHSQCPLTACEYRASLKY